MNYFAVLYHYAADSERIAAIRPEHREFLGELLNQGIVVGSGPYTDGNGGALIIIRLPESATAEDAAELMNRDPFHLKGALSGRDIRPWNPVLNIFGD
ncbi:hypothetical protein GSS88_09375 [Corynebacterium sp. 3HC-13]|uniref:YciI family protein n=1 Tax=Corynebacterium poyangense TaxID=2684405 RepID=UPI001CC90F03|nr:YciI family protein [Corynebacterium poyangense]MBZ8177993.1 hypothetical protein [Corynebacterium poyangense]